MVWIHTTRQTICQPFQAMYLLNTTFRNGDRLMSLNTRLGEPIKDLYLTEGDYQNSVLPEDLLPDAVFPLGHMRRLKPRGPINLTSVMLQNYEAINLLAQVEALILALKVNETYVTYDFVPTNRTITLPDGATKDVVQSIFSHIISCEYFTVKLQRSSTAD